MALTIKHYALLAVAGASAATAVQSANAVATKKPAAAKPKAAAQASAQAASSTSLPAVPPFAPWPKAPLGGKPYVAWKYAVPIGLSGPQMGLPEADSVQPSVSPGVRGLLVYAAKSGNRYPAPNPGNWYLVMRSIGQNGDAAASAHYHFAVDVPYRETMLAQDGRSLFFGVGGTGRHQGLAPHRWDLSSGSLNAFPGINSTARTSYSASGKYFGVLFDYSDEQLMQPLHAPWREAGSTMLEVEDTTSPFRYLPDAELNRSWQALAKYADYSPQEARDPALRGYPFWRVSNNAARRSVVWTSRNTLLYTHEPAKVVRRLPDQAAPQQAEEFPSIWIADPRTRANRLLIARAYDPAPSPDGRTIAFFGWPLNLKPTPAQPAPPPSLFLYDTASGRTVQATAQNSGFVLWTPDSRRLISVQFPSDDEAHISTLEVEAALQGPVTAQAALKEVAVIKSQDFEPTNRIWPLPISVAAVARNGKYLVLDLSRYTGAQGSRYVEEKELQGVDLDSGQVSTIARAKPQDPNDPFSWSWFDLSDAPTTESQR